jgi:hypothetical protein
MHPPAVAAKRLLLGTGVGLMLGVGFGLQSGRWGPEEPPLALVFAVVAGALLALGWSLGRGSGPLAGRFSDETDEAMARRVKEEIDDVQRSESVNAKWARLEADVLAKDLGEQE